MRGPKKGSVRGGSMLWRLLKLKPGKSFYTHAEQKAIWRDIKKAVDRTGDKWTTQDIWAVPMNRQSQPEIITRVTRTA
jgi:hypothetical protein